MEQIKALFVKYKEVILYVVFGLLTTLVNFAALWLIKEVAGLETWGGRLANALAWAAAVLFAFVTNKNYVFASRGKDRRTVARQTLMFYASRLFTLGVETATLKAGEVLLGHEYFWYAKVAASVLVVILNYVLSKLLVFAKRREKEKA